MKKIRNILNRLRSDRDREIQIKVADMPKFIDPDLSILTGRKTGMAGHFLIVFSLARESMAEHIVEIGLGSANSALAFLLALEETGGKLTTIEIDPDPAAIQRIENEGFAANWNLITGASEDVVGQLHPDIDMLFIDGKHSYNQCKKDYESYEPLVKKGGFILFHDSVSIKGVKEFTSELKKKLPECLNLPFCNGIFLVRKVNW